MKIWILILLLITGWVCYKEYNSTVIPQFTDKQIEFICIEEFL